MTAPSRRLRSCVESWPGAYTGGFDPRCCRFPKSCSATVYGDEVADEDLEPAVERQPVDVAAGEDERDEEIRQLHGECAGLLRVLDMVRHAVYDYLPGHDAGRLILSLVNGPADKTAPHVLRLPAEPADAVALVSVDNPQRRYTPTGRTPYAWRLLRTTFTFAGVLEREPQGVTVELPGGAA